MSDDANHDPGDSLRVGIRQLINSHCAENASDTPDFVLADFLIDCLNAFDAATQARSSFYGKPARPRIETLGHSANPEQKP